MIDPLSLSLKQIQDYLQKGEISPLTLCLETLKRIKAFKHLNAFLTVPEEQIMHQAELSAKRIGANNALVLDGIPIAIKDIFCTKGIRTTAASKILNNFIPQYESTVTQKLLDKGMINIGKTNMDEFAMGSSNEYSAFGPVINPHSPEGTQYVPGGSSGGSAAAVAAKLCFAALGSDTGGSIRQPASFCGIVGIKPSYGRCSRFGMIAYSSSLDQAGVLARSVEDACIVLDQIMGPCTADSTTSSERPPVLAEVLPHVRNKRIGYVKEQFRFVEDYVKEDWQKNLEILRQAGAELVELDLNQFCNDGDNTQYAHKWLGAYYILSPVEAFSNFCRYDGIRYGSYIIGEDLQHTYENTRNQFGHQVQKRMALGGYLLSLEQNEGLYSNSIMYRKLLQAQFNSIFKQVDVILSPTSPNEAFEIGQKAPLNDMYNEDLFTVIANLIGAPAISIPSGCGPRGLPLGVHLMAKPFDEVNMIQVAKFLEDKLQFNQKDAQ